MSQLLVDGDEDFGFNLLGFDEEEELRAGAAAMIVQLVAAIDEDDCVVARDAD